MLTCSSSLSPSQRLVANSATVSNVSATSTQRPSLNESKKFPYKAAQQVKFLYLEAEIESLLQQLQTLKQQRVADASRDVVNNWEG